MDTSTWRRGRRAEIDTLRRGRVGIEPNRRPCEQLPEILHATGDIAANIVGVVLLHRRRPKHAARQHAIAKAWRETLDLLLDPLGHVECRAVRNMAVGPGGVLALGRAGRVEQAGL